MRLEVHQPGHKHIRDLRDADVEGVHILVYRVRWPAIFSSSSVMRPWSCMKLVLAFKSGIVFRHSKSGAQRGR